MLDAIGIQTLDDLHQLTKRAVKSESGIKVGKEFDEPDWANHLGDFSIRTLCKLPNALRPSAPRIRSQYDTKVSLGTKERKIQNDFELLLANKHPHMTQAQKLNFEPGNFPLNHCWFT
jgi:hypothetical protein